MFLPTYCSSVLFPRNCATLFGLSLQDLEEELELDRRRVSEAEGVAKRAEEELAVAKERLLLQEDELQSRAGMSVCKGLVRISLAFHNSFCSFTL